MIEVIKLLNGSHFSDNSQIAVFGKSLHLNGKKKKKRQCNFENNQLIIDAAITEEFMSVVEEDMQYYRVTKVSEQREL